VTKTYSTAAVFLDRDGTLMHDVGYPNDPDSVVLLDGAAKALATLRQKGFRLVVVSNQSGIARGLVTPTQAAAVHERFVDELSRNGAALDDARYCPHGPGDGCSCRKPEAGLLVSAANDLGIDTESSFLIGDKESDVEAGRRVGCRTILLAHERNVETQADYVAADWSEAIAIILSAGGGPG
jgi:D-glycero-D-manno-heptose 1,7-bisphosphate phosphatase